MKKLIFFIIFVFIALEAAKHPLFKDWVERMEQKVLTKASNTVGKTSLTQIITELSLLKNTISPEEVSYLSDNINTSEEAKIFKATYCDNKSQLRHNVLTSHAFEQACNVLNKHLE